MKKLFLVLTVLVTLGVANSSFACDTQHGNTGEGCGPVQYDPSVFYVDDFIGGTINGVATIDAKFYITRYNSFAVVPQEVVSINRKTKDATREELAVLQVTKTANGLYQVYATAGTAYNFKSCSVQIDTLNVPITNSFEVSYKIFADFVLEKSDFYLEPMLKVKRIQVVGKDGQVFQVKCP